MTHNRTEKTVIHVSVKIGQTMHHLLAQDLSHGVKRINCASFSTMFFGVLK